MKFIFLNLQSAKEEWSDQAIQLYQKKISHFVKLEMKTIKGENFNRSFKEARVEKESQKIFDFLEKDDFLIVFDEKGKSLNSLDFSKNINLILNSGKKRVVFLIGGAFGLSDELKKRANLNVSLSNLTFNHLIAQLIVLEQIYRSFSILNNLPYHNE
ncbi:MAG: 23S rRNA (pseudouridine(1915)-N(3))-methyltransferase RlmH [Deltaproteobacteria bacterium]|jgi:23S rRNA (pseudouridine1915-N3)-methyltransferase|nr:23S rRNA (pseudouridine(1915)-N(3))-methyltransferase RlmH [Deltaproteobacteria bacterium]